MNVSASRPPRFRVYSSPAFQDLIARVYDLEPIPGVGQGSGLPMPTLFRSRKPFRGSEGFLLPFQFYTTLDLAGAEDAERWFAALRAWSTASACNITLTSFDDYGQRQCVPVAHNPVLFLPPDAAGIEAGYSRNLRSGLRRNANKAQRLGIEIVDASDEAELAEFHRRVLAPQYVRRHRMVFQPYGLFRGLWAAGLARLVVARRQGRCIGGLVLIDDGEGVHYAWGASESPDQVAVGTLMLRHAIESSAARGLRWFDFGSTPLTDTALHEFKLRWGSTSFPVVRHYTLHPPNVIDLNVSFDLPRRLYSLLPPGWARALMPIVVPWLVS